MSAASAQRPGQGLRRTVEDIRSMKVRGAGAIGVAGAQALADHVQTLEGRPNEVLQGARQAACELDTARPTAVTLHNGLGWVLAAVAAASSLAEQKRNALQAARLVAEQAKASKAAIAQQGARHMPDDGLVLTHCHSSAAVAVLAAAHKAGKRFDVIATETRPFRQGLLTVKALREAGIDCALTVDSAVEHHLATRDVDAVLVGADAVARDGSLFNKIGTSGVAALAHLRDVPVYSAAGLHKFTTRGPEAIPIEERDGAEVVGLADLPPGVRVLNPVFDRTPPDRITGYLTEEGLLSPAKAVARNVPQLPPEEVWR